MRYRKPYTLYTIPMKDGTTVYYYRTYDASGRRTSGISTGCSSVSEARRYCDRLLRTGKLIPGSRDTFREYTRDWFIPGSCPYTTARNARRTGRPIAAAHVTNQRHLLTAHVWPVIGAKRLREITPGDLDRLVSVALQKELAAETANKVLAVARIVLQWAARHGDIESDPSINVERVSGVPVGRGSLSVAEAGKILNPRTKKTYWASDRAYVINLLAALTGLRVGECLALRAEDVAKDHVIVRMAKNGRPRVVPIPALVYAELARIMPRSGFAFSTDAGKSAMNRRNGSHGLIKALEKIGIAEKQRTARGIVFHSWRRFFNTQLRAAGVADALVRATVGHQSAAMTEHYTDWRPEHYAPVVEAQSKILTFKKTG